MSNLLKELSTYKPLVKESNKREEHYEDLLESIEDLMEKFSLFGNKDKVTNGKLTMSKIHTVVLSPGDGGIELKDKVFGIRNEDPIVDFMLQAMGVPMDGASIRIRSGFMQYDKRSKMLFIAKFKSDLPNERSNMPKENPEA